MFDKAQLEAFSAVLETGSFSEASRRLSVTQSAITQRIKSLEAATGHLLILRQRPPRPTPAGTALLRYAKQLRLLDQEVNAVLSGTDSGRPGCSIAVNADSLATWFMDAWEHVAKECGVLLQIHVEDQDHTPRLLSEGLVSGVVTSLPEALPGCTIRPLGTMDYVCVCRRDFYERYFEGKPMKDALRVAPAMRFNNKDLIHAEFVWRTHRIKDTDIPMHDIPSSLGMVEGVRRGVAYGFLPSSHAAVLIRDDEAVDVFPRFSVPVPLFWHEWSVAHSVLREVGKRVIQVARISLRQ